MTKQRATPSRWRGLLCSKPAWLETQGFPATSFFLGHASRVQRPGTSMMDKPDSTVAENIGRTDESNSTVAEQIARAAGALENRRTNHGRDWLVVFLNEDTIAIALHGSLTVAEKSVAQSLAGAHRFRSFTGSFSSTIPTACFERSRESPVWECATLPRKSIRRAAAWCRFSRPTRWWRSSCLFPTYLPGHSAPRRHNGSACREASVQFGRLQRPGRQHRTERHRGRFVTVEFGHLGSN